MAPPIYPRQSFERVTVVASGNPNEKSFDVQNSSGTSQFSVDASTSAITSTGGIAASTGSPTVFWANHSVPPTTTTGTDTTPTAGSIYVSAVYIPVSCTLTGISVLNGSAVGSDKWCAALYTYDGVKVANSATAGTTCSGTAAMQALAFTATYSAKGPGLYFISLSCNGTTARFRSQIIGVAPTTSQAGSFGTPDAITVVPTTFTTGVGPIAATY